MATLQLNVDAGDLASFIASFCCGIGATNLEELQSTFTEKDLMEGSQRVLLVMLEGLKDYRANGPKLTLKEFLEQ